MRDSHFIVLSSVHSKILLSENSPESKSALKGDKKLVDAPYLIHQEQKRPDCCMNNQSFSNDILRNIAYLPNNPTLVISE